MKIERLVLRDWGPFAGEHVIEFGDGLHVVVGENGAGKSLALAAIPWALYGSIPGTTAEQLVHDGGAKESSVSLWLSDGIEISRGWDCAGKGAGWVRMSGVEDARARDAVDAFVERSSLSAADFRATVFLGMGDPGSLVTAGPAARRDQFGTWIVPAIWSELAAKSTARVKTLAGRVLSLQGALRSLAPEDVAELKERLSVATSTRNLAASRVLTPEVVRGAERAKAQVEEARRRSNAMIELLAAEPPWPQEMQADPIAVAAQREKLARWRGELAKIERLAAGKFDGPCPVDGVACPRAEDIRARAEQHRSRAEKGRVQIVELAATISVDEQAIAQKQSEQTAHDRWWERVVALLDAPQIPDVSIEMLRKSRGEHIDLGGFDREIGELRARLSRAEIDTERVQAIDAELKELEPMLIGWRWMERATGRDGVPAMLLDAAIGEIAAEGNAVLAAAGVALQFEFRLRKELKKVADRCRCGALFAPRTRKCSECGEARGQQVEHDCIPLVRGSEDGIARTWRSSGQEAMLAVGLRIGAAAWRRRRSGCPWSTLVLDEVEGPLSDENAAAVREVVRAAPTLGFAQQIMVSHRPASRLAGQRLIRVIRDGDRSRLVCD